MNALNHQVSKNYRKIQVESASPEKLVLMLYDAAVRKLDTAETLLDAGNLERFHETVVRVQKILSELLGALDPTQAEELVQNLERLYEYMLRQLSLALVRRSAEPVREVKTLLEELREGWKGVVEQQMKKEAETGNPGKNERPASVPCASSSETVSTLNISG